MDLMIESLPKLLNATKLTIQLTLLSLFFGIFVGVFFAILRTSKNRVFYFISYYYSYIFRANCYCIDEWVTEAKVTIDNDTISSVVFTKNDLSPTTLSPNQWHTIDELFDIAKTAINEAHIYSIEYDNSPYGNPKIIDIDWAENTADDEVTFYINNISKK